MVLVVEVKIALMVMMLIIQSCYEDDIKRAEQRCKNLQEEIEQKIKDLEEVTDLCISKEELEDLMVQYKKDLIR